MDWFKHSTTAMMTATLRVIWHKYRAAGVGMFWIIYEILKLRRGSCLLSDIYVWACRDMKKTEIYELLTEVASNVFKVVGEQVFLILSHEEELTDETANPLVCVGAEAPAQPPAGTPAGPPAPPYDSPEKKEKNRLERRDDGGDVEETAAADYDGKEGFQRSIDAMVKRLTCGPEHQSWREMIAMSCPQLRDILEKQLAWALDFFLRYAVANGKDLALYDVREAKSYFFRFCNYGKTRERLLEAFRNRNRLSQARGRDDPNNPYRFEVVDADGRRTYDGQPIPADAPPRPSDSAQWDYGGGMWY